MEMMIDALAGTLESSDVMVRIGPANEPGIQLEIDSIVKQQFGAAIEQVVRDPGAAWCHSRECGRR